VRLPADNHVHTQWSWDAGAGDMVATCERAVAIGLPVVAFTEHLDHTVTFVPEHIALAEPLAQHLDGTRLVPPPFDVAGYLGHVEECRQRFPDLRILSGLEIGEPHWHADAVRAVLAAGTFDRLLGSLHCLPDGDTYAEPPGLFATRGLDEVFREYLLEIPRLVEGSTDFSVLAHIDYPLRYWRSTEPVDLASFEEEFRVALTAVAAGGRALEINTVLPLDAVVLRWWFDVGGEAITFGSDAHEPEDLASGFAEAVELAEASGFRPGDAPHELWGRGLVL
jgi:histidinol-phosphatase (PHP family)